MRGLAQLACSFGPPPLTVALVFLVAYLVVGIPVHVLHGSRSRDVIGTLAGIFAALAYLTLVLGFCPDCCGTLDR